MTPYLGEDTRRWILEAQFEWLETGAVGGAPGLMSIMGVSNRKWHRLRTISAGEGVHCGTADGGSIHWVVTVFFVATGLLA